MQNLSSIEKNVNFPYKEMLAYETLWAIEGIKDNNLKRFFNNYTPSKTLKEMLNQANLDFFLSKTSHDEIKNKVNEFLKKSLANELNTFSIVVNKSFQYPEDLSKELSNIIHVYDDSINILLQILTHIETGRFSKLSFSKEYKVAPRTLDRYITILKKHKFILFEGAKKTGKYKITEKYKKLKKSI